MTKKIKNAWAFYDWANSVYSLVIASAIFPIYYNAVTSSEASSDVNLFGFTLNNNALYSYSLSFSFLVVALLSPLLSGIADSNGKKKNFLRFFCYLGSVSCASLYFFTGPNLVYGLVASILASIGFWSSIVFYNSFLPEIAPPEEQDALSAKGFSLGYIGSSILLIVVLVLVQMPETFGFENSGSATRFSFLLVGAWWMGFATYTLRYLPNNPYHKKPQERYIWKGYQELRKVYRQLSEHKSLGKFLGSFFFFSIGVQTVLLLASLFGSEELGLDSSKLIVTILLIQFVAIAGAHLFARIARKKGNLIALKISIGIWVLLCVGAYTLSKTDPWVEYKFYALGAIVGLVMGGIQSVSRSTYSKLLPETQSHASFFSFYDVAEKVAIVLGTLIYGWLVQITGSMKMSILALSVFFIIGFVLMLRVPKTKEVH